MNPDPNPEPRPEPPAGRRILGLAGLIAAAVAVCYAWSLRGAFLYDDIDSIAANTSLRSLAAALTPPAGATVSGRPVLNLTFALNHALGGYSVTGYHATNLLIHALSALLLFGITRRTLGAVPALRLAPWDAALTAFAVALVWAVHPLQVESVAYVVQRAESLMGLFLLLTLYAFVRLAGGGRPGWVWSSLSLGACLLGMGCKEVMVVAPLVVLLYDRAFVSGSMGAALRSRRALYAGYAACWIPLAWLVLRSAGRGGSAGFGSGVPWWAYALTQFKAVAHYLWLCVWPHPLVGDYGRILAGDPLEVAFCAALVLGLAAATWALLRRNAPLGFAGAWFFLILAPSSSVVPVSTEIMAEHRMYLPLAAVVAVLVLALGTATSRRLALLAAVVASVGLGLLSVRRTGVYRDSYAFWSDVARKVPANAGAWNNLGLILEERGDSRGAMEDFLRALSVAPTYAHAHYNLANALLAAGHPDEAVEHLQKALEFRPDDPAVHLSLGNALGRQGRWLPAAAQYRESLRLDPARTDALFLLGDMLLKAGNLPEATATYRSLVDAHPDLAAARVNFGNVLAEQGRVAEAVAEYRQALRLEPDAADVHNNLGSLLAGTGDLGRARAEFEEALRIKPDYPDARDNLARVKALLEAQPKP